MQHDWIFEVLADLQAYAARNGLPLLAAKADEALRVARAEIPALNSGGTGSQGGGAGDRHH
jgi:hypothetical protein